MNSIFDVVHKNRLMFFISAICIFFFGISAYMSIPKEEYPDIKLPTVNVTIVLPGVSPEDAEKMIILPIEKALHSLDNIKKVTAFAINGAGNITIQFNQSVKIDKAVQDIRNKIQEARSDMPQDIKEPIITDIDLSKLPVLSVALLNEQNEEKLFEDAKFLKKRIELVPGVVRVNAVGLRKEVISCTIDPAKWAIYGITLDGVMNMLGANNNLVSLGEMANKSNFAVKLSGLLRNDKEISFLPVTYKNGAVIKLSDFANVKWGLEEQVVYGRVNFKPAVILEVSKKAATNTVQIIDRVKSLIDQNKSYLSDTTSVVVMRDTSAKVTTSLHDLINNIIFAIILVMSVIIIQIGIKQGIVVGLSIPLSFFSGIIVLKLMGYSMNIVVLFALIMVVGMIVDAAIIVTEDADWRMHNGVEPIPAYLQAAQRMSIPVLSATVGIIVVFMPLLFWPGIVGEFMKYIPITLIIVLTASIIVAMFFVPVIGGAFCNKYGFKDNLKPDHWLFKSRDWIENVSDLYVQKLDKILDKPKRIPLLLPIVFVVTIVFYSIFGYGTQFFPDIEPDNIMVNIRAQGNLSPKKKLEITKKAEDIIEQKYVHELKSVYSNVNPELRSVEDVNDSVAIISLEYKDWHDRRPSADIIANLRKDLALYKLN